MPKPSLYIVRQDRGGVAYFIADEIGASADTAVSERFAWTTDKSAALSISRSTARRLAAIAAVEHGRSAMVLPHQQDER